jgi:hypothetical protein
MSTPLNVARSVSSGTRGVPWLLFIPALLIAFWIANSTPQPPILIRRSDWLIILDLGIFVVLFLVWYFVFARIPVTLQVRNVRRQVSDAVLVSGVILVSVAEDAIWRGRTREFHRAGANVIVATRSDLQFWGGTGDNARPLLSIEWPRIESIAGVAGVAKSALVTISIRESQVPLRFILVSNETLSTIKLRGSVRDRRVAQLNAIRLEVDDDER